jgi:hypothetical protein
MPSMPALPMCCHSIDPNDILHGCGVILNPGNLYGVAGVSKRSFLQVFL